MATDVAPGSNAFFDALAGAAYENIVEKGFDRGDEEDSDQEGVRLANKAGYAPNGLATFLGKLAERNKNTPTRNALFASHPETQGRIEKIGNQVKSEKLAAAAMVEPRYVSQIKFEAKPCQRSRDGRRRNARGRRRRKGKEGREAARGKEEERIRPRQPGALVRQAG